MLGNQPLPVPLLGLPVVPGLGDRVRPRCPEIQQRSWPAVASQRQPLAACAPWPGRLVDQPRIAVVLGLDRKPKPVVTGADIPPVPVAVRISLFGPVHVEGRQRGGQGRPHHAGRGRRQAHADVELAHSRPLALAAWRLMVPGKQAPVRQSGGCDQAAAGIQGWSAVSMTRASQKVSPCLAAVDR